MRKLFLFLAIFICFTNASATDSLTYKKAVFKVKLTTAKGNTIKGYLNNLDDNCISITSVVRPYRYTGTEANKMQIICYDSISKVKVSWNGRGGRGILFGVASGAVAGAIVGLASYKKCPPGGFCIFDGPGYDALAGASLGIVTGFFFGALTGALSKKTFLIDSKKEAFEKMRSVILKKVIVRQ